jgi:hypothetical protein
VLEKDGKIIWSDHVKKEVFQSDKRRGILYKNKEKEG